MSGTSRSSPRRRVATAVAPHSASAFDSTGCAPISSTWVTPSASSAATVSAKRTGERRLAAQYRASSGARVASPASTVEKNSRCGAPCGTSPSAAASRAAGPAMAGPCEG